MNKNKNNKNKNKNNNNNMQSLSITRKYISIFLFLTAMAGFWSAYGIRMIKKLLEIPALLSYDSEKLRHHQQQQQQLISKSFEPSATEKIIKNDGNNDNNDTSMIVSNMNNNIINNNNNPQQKFILLAGPHKAASTTLQTNAVMYVKLYPETWNWIYPPKWDTISRYRRGGPKSFATFFQGLAEPQEYLHSRNINITSESIIHMFKNETQKKWDEGYNIIIGSEGIDRITLDNSTRWNNTKLFDRWNNTKLFDQLLEIFPTNGEEEENGKQRYTSLIDNISIVIVYRSPRKDHLLSWWTQSSKYKNAICRNCTLYEFIDHRLYYRFNGIDSLKLTKMFLEKEFKVDLIDLTGVYNSDYDLFSILGCDIMKVTCDKNKIPKQIKRRENYQHIIKQMTEKKNVGKPGIKNVTDIQIDLMDNLLRQYDCIYKDYLLNHPNLTIHYDNQFHNNLQQCDHHQEENNDPNVKNTIHNVDDLLISLQRVLYT